VISGSKTKIYKLGGQVLDIPIIGRREYWYLQESPHTLAINLAFFQFVNPSMHCISGLYPKQKSDSNPHKK
jgi:hypothetical protein